MHTAAIILAAGSASRMQTKDQPLVAKMLLPFRGKPLLQQVIGSASAVASPCIVVTGCFHKELQPLLLNLQVHAVFNAGWEQGMGSSLATGISFIQQHQPEAEEVFILPADQPFIDQQLLEEMKSAAGRTGKGIVACTYAGTVGTPVLFNRKYFARLSALQGNQGARLLLQEYGDDRIDIRFPEGAHDIDTPEDYARIS